MLFLALRLTLRPYWTAKPAEKMDYGLRVSRSGYIFAALIMSAKTPAAVTSAPAP
jgi:hypothetical protein